MADSSPSGPWGSYPNTRLRRPRREEWCRRLVREASLTASDLIWPLFVCEGDNHREPVPSMPGVERLSIDFVVEAVGEAIGLGIPAVALFPATDPDKKTPECEEAVNPENLVCRAVRAVKSSHGANIGVVCDVALDPYSSHGQDGLVRDGYVVNDETNDLLCRQAIVQAEAGCDIIAPSDMMDGRIGAIRRALDESQFRARADHGLCREICLGLLRAVPRRGRLLGQPWQGDKRTYQMDPANGDEALREVALDIAEGADMVMVKPGMPYLDIVRRVKETFGAADLRLPGERRIRDARGRGRARLARSRSDDARKSHGFQTGRRRWRAHLFRPRRGEASPVAASLRLTGDA